ncbi:MAG: cytidyltransferase, partial [Verrucomicrobia bacterium]|nr:cytidyltransferase [Verrucomicrobiota bacterium]
RFLEEHLSAKLFEVYEMRNEQLTPALEEQFLKKLDELLPQFDVVVVADYGHGLLTERAVHLICARAKFLAVNVQVNAGNRGFNLISKYPHADFVSLGEPEVRLDARKLNDDLAVIIRATAARIGTQFFLVTRGGSGCYCCDQQQNIVEVPAFAIRVVDRVGAGDAVFALTAPCAALGIPAESLGFIANVVGAEACMIMGHRSFVDPTSLFRHITSLMK